METPVVKLLSPVAHGATTVTDLTFREPKGADVCLAGHPFKITRNADGSITTSFDANAITNMIAALTNQPPSVIKALSLPDWSACMEIVGGFFGNTAADASAPGIS